MAGRHSILKKGDIYLLAGITAAALLLLLISHFLRPTVTSGTAEITVNGTLYGEYALDEERSFTIESPDGGYNRVEIQNGEVYVSEADCPDRLCVRQGVIRRRGDTVVCLPHGLVITVRDGEKGDVDLIR